MEMHAPGSLIPTPPDILSLLEQDLSSLPSLWNQLLNFWKEGTHPATLHPGDEDWMRVENLYRRMQEALSRTSQPIYGVTTGFGKLANVRISPSQQSRLQENLILSHAAGMGNAIPLELTRFLLWLRLRYFLEGRSPLQPEVLRRMWDLYRRDWLPYVPAEGSLGASGDLAPLAHLSLPLLGKGFLWIHGQWLATAHVYQKMHWNPVRLGPRDGIALINSTHYSLALLIWNLVRLFRLWMVAHVVAGWSMRVFCVREDQFSPTLEKVSAHPFRQLSFRYLRQIFQKCPERSLPPDVPEPVQDPYSFRCFPHVMGAIGDAIQWACEIAWREWNSVVDNPVFQDGSFYSGGHFHTEPLLLVADTLRQAVERLIHTSERRQNHLLSGTRGLPPFLAIQPGVESGLMVGHYSATSLVASASIEAGGLHGVQAWTSAGQEDHVSFAPVSLWNLHRLIDRAYQILAWEWILATRAWWISAGDLPDSWTPLIQWSTHAPSSFWTREGEIVPAEAWASALKFLQTFPPTL